MISRFSTMFCAVAVTVVEALPAAAQDTVKIAYVDHCPAAARASARSA